MRQTARNGLYITLSVLLIVLSTLTVLVLLALFPPIKDREFITGESDGGFFSRITCMAAGAKYGEDKKAGKIILVNKDKLNEYTTKDSTLVDYYLEDKEFVLKENFKPASAYQKWIDSINPIKIAGKYYPLRIRHTKKFWGRHREIFPAKSGLPLYEISDAINKYIHFKKRFEDTAEQWYRDNVLSKKPDYVICVHYRGTDNFLEFPYEKSDPELYLNYMDHLSKKNKNSVIFIATDQQSFAEESKKRFHNCVMYESPRSNNSAGLYKEGVFGVYELGESVIIDAILLSKGDHLIKGRSNVSVYSLFRHLEMECTIIMTEDLQWYKPEGRKATFSEIKVQDL